MLQASRGLSIERIRAGRAIRCALAFVLAALVAGFAMAGIAVTPASAIFRAFSPSSPWNRTAVPTSLRLRATARGFGHSNVIHVRLRH
jgi:hypothetical protein